MSLLKKIYIKFGRLMNVSLGILSYGAFPSSLRVKFLRMKGVRVGNNTFIGLHVSIDSSFPKKIVIGKNCGIAAGASFLAHRRDIVDYSIDKGYNDYSFKIMNVVIEDNVQIGTNAIILPGITIGKGAIIAAGSVVTKNIPQHSLAAGIPAKVIKNLIGD